MTTIPKHVFVVAGLLLWGAPAAWAYIDPGTGMAFVSGIGAWVAAFAAAILGGFSLFFRRWVDLGKKLFARLRRR